MAEENNTTMNIGLNLGRVDNSSDNSERALESYPNRAVNLEDGLDSHVRVHEVGRWRRSPIPPETQNLALELLGGNPNRAANLEDGLDSHVRVHEVGRWRRSPIPPETQNLALELLGGNPLPETGEGSVASGDRRPNRPTKTCENNTGFAEEDGDSVKKKKDGDKNNGDGGVLFDCNICLDLAKDPVVTCCGHLFCWPCLYRWLHHHSDAKECPICKGEVTMVNVTPIYGLGNSNSGNSNSRDPDMDPSLKIPFRPQARRIESRRQAFQRSAFTTERVDIMYHISAMNQRLDAIELQEWTWHEEARTWHEEARAQHEEARRVQEETRAMIRMLWERMNTQAGWNRGETSNPASGMDVDPLFNPSS